MAMFYMQYKVREKAAKVVEFVAKWLNLCLSTVVSTTFNESVFDTLTMPPNNIAMYVKYCSILTLVQIVSKGCAPQQFFSGGIRDSV